MPKLLSEYFCIAYMNDTQENRSLGISIYAYIMNATTTNNTRELSQKEKRAARDKERYAANKEKIKARNKNWRLANREKHASRSKEWAKNNKQIVRASNRNWDCKQVETNPLYKAKKKLRSAINSAFKRIKQNKPSNTQILLGCTWEEAKAHFELLFQEGMSWENHGKWHIDHIRPVASFNEDELHLMNHITNLQPLWAKDNLQKSDEYL